MAVAGTGRRPGRAARPAGARGGTVGDRTGLGGPGAARAGRRALLPPGSRGRRGSMLDRGRTGRRGDRRPRRAGRRSDGTTDHLLRGGHAQPADAAMGGAVEQLAAQPVSGGCRDRPFGGDDGGDEPRRRGAAPATMCGPGSRAARSCSCRCCAPSCGGWKRCSRCGVGDFAEAQRHHAIAAHVHEQTELYEAGSGLLATASLLRETGRTGRPEDWAGVHAQPGVRRAGHGRPGAHRAADTGRPGRRHGPRRSGRCSDRQAARAAPTSGRPWATWRCWPIWPPTTGCRSSRRTAAGELWTRSATASR